MSSIEESRDLDAYTMDQLYGALTAFEMRDVERDKTKKEVTFKVSKKMEDDRSESKFCEKSKEYKEFNENNER